MTKVFLVRHGQSEANLKGIFAGRTDLELSDLGRKQAEAVGKYLCDKDIDMIYSSPLKRAMSTAKPLSDLISKPVIPCDGIIEIYAGEWEAKEFSELSEKFPETYGLWLSDIGNSVCDGGESMAEVQQRMIKTISGLCEKEDGKIIALFAHAGCFRAFLCHCLNMTKEQMKDLSWVSNASVTTLEYENGKFKVVDLDYADHLDGMVSNLPKNV